MSVTIYHNPACGTSRKALEQLREAGADVRVVEYLKTPPSRAELDRLVAKGIAARDLLRAKSPVYAELNLGDETLSDTALLNTLAERPELLNRPVVETAQAAVVARPPERALSLL